MDEEEQEKLVTFHLDLSKVFFIWILAFGRIFLGHFSKHRKLQIPTPSPKRPTGEIRNVKIPRKGFPPMMEKEGEKIVVFVGALFEKSHNDLTLRSVLARHFQKVFCIFDERLLETTWFSRVFQISRLKSSIFLHGTQWLQNTVVQFDNSAICFEDHQYLEDHPT